MQVTGRLVKKMKWRFIYTDMNLNLPEWNVDTNINNPAFH